MKVAHNKLGSYSIELEAPTSAAGFDYRVYQRAISADIVYCPSKVCYGQDLATFIIGVEIILPWAPISKSPWNFTSSDLMENWDVILCIGETKFYAHKSMLSFISTTFRSMFEGEFREKNQQEVPVNVEGIGPDHFEAFLQCIYPGGNELKGEFNEQLVTLTDFYHVKHVLNQCVGIVGLLPNVPKMELLRTAVKINSEALENAVIATFTRDDLQGLLASDLKDQRDGARWQKLLAKALAF
ncbi:kelch-like protein 18-like [Aphelenchoides avenae]|nr:kelch-like protein 18-like [Aphelenchus avenae]